MPTSTWEYTITFGCWFHGGYIKLYLTLFYLLTSSDSFVNTMNAITLPCTAAILSAILEFAIGIVANFYSWCALSLRTIQRKKLSLYINKWHLGISRRIYVKVQQLISGIITHYLVKSEVSILINGWVTANYRVIQPPFCSPSWNL